MTQQEQGCLLEDMRLEQTETQREQKSCSEELELQQAVKEAAELQFGTPQGQGHLLVIEL